MDPLVAEEKQRIAILLHGHSCTGKTSTGKLLWGEEPICLDGGPPYDRLRRAEDVIVLDLGCGEFRPDRRLGPTRNPEEWLRILAEEKRALFAFLLTADWPAVEARARAEHDRGVTLQSARQSYELYCTRHEGVTFPATAGIRERPIDTTRMTLDEVVAEIRKVVNNARTIQRWP